MARNHTLSASHCEHFYFLRHGQTPRNASRIFQGPDEPLSDLGISQAEAASALLNPCHFETVVCSDMLRARQTAAIAAGPHSLLPIDHAGLRERNFGRLIGTSSAQIDWACVPEAGETLETFVSRTCAGLTYALSHTSPTLIVAHGGTLYVLAALLGIDVDVSLLGNAHPLRFEQTVSKWTVTPLAAARSDPLATPNLA